MKVTPGLPVTALSGTSKNSQLVYYTLGEQLVARARVEPENPRSYNQVIIRGMRKKAGSHWRELNPETRAAYLSAIRASPPAFAFCQDSIDHGGSGAFLFSCEYSSTMHWRLSLVPCS